MDDDVGALDGAAEAGRVSHVAWYQLGAPGGKGRRGAIIRPAYEATHGLVSFTQRVHDPQDRRNRLRR